jgi:DNA-binding CsgD family transcriptional regulator
MVEDREGGALTPDRLDKLVAPASATASSVALLIVDDERRLVEANPAACSLLDAPRSELLGQRLDALIAPAMRKRLDNVWQAFRDQRGHAGPFELAGGQKEGRRVDIGVASEVLPGRHLVVLAASGEPLATASPPAESREGRARGPTTREREVLALLAGGATDGQIARKLALSPATVQTHVRNVKAKLGARTRAQAVAVALRRGVISTGV